MALDADQIVLLHEALEIPLGPSAIEFWGVLGEGSAPQSFTFAVATQAIATLLTQLTQAQEDRLSALLEEYKQVATSESRLTAAEGVEGVIEDSAERRKLIRQRIQNLVPVFREGEIVARERAYRGQGSNLILRG